MEQSNLIGKNYVYNIKGKKYVFGIPDTLVVFILILSSMTFIVITWLISTHGFFSLITRGIGFIMYILMMYYLIICFFTEPGIIPRKHPDHQTFNRSIELTASSSCISLGDIEKKDEVLSDDKESIKPALIPSILTERQCKTCQIVKPPKASHCSICDDCVINLDHHCFFISNCVGKRNHKYFFLFLIYGSILSIYVTILTSWHCIYTLFIYDGNIFPRIFNYSLTWSIIGLIALFFLLMSGWCQVRDMGFILTPAVVAYSIFCYLFYASLPQDKQYPFYYNPFGLMTFLGALFHGIFVIITLVPQLDNITNGYTHKEIHSIKKSFDSTIKRENQVFAKFIEGKSMSERWSNLTRFMREPVPPSLIQEGRDV